MNLTRQFTDFFESEKAGGIILICCTVVSLVLANSAVGAGYKGLWESSISGIPVSLLINDGLMAVFFLMIGLELERELYTGELSDWRSASLPVVAAMGGMLVPSAIYLIFNFGSIYHRGAGIPMATDIAFAVGIISLLGNKVPSTLKVFLIALAVIDDLGAVLVIAIFYTGSFSLIHLLIALAIFGFLLALNRFRVDNLFVYLTGGLALWYFIHESGIHATISGILLAFAIPFRRGAADSPSNRLLHVLHKPVAFFVLPLFALSNTGIELTRDHFGSLTEPYAFGILAGLVIGKPLGILLFTSIAHFSGISPLPRDLNWCSLTGAGFLAGIGFTMSIFITLLAFTEPYLVSNAKLAILIGSAMAGIAGFSILKYGVRKC